MPGVPLEKADFITAVCFNPQGEEVVGVMQAADLRVVAVGSESRNEGAAIVLAFTFPGHTVLQIRVVRGGVWELRSSKDIGRTN